MERIMFVVDSLYAGGSGRVVSVLANKLCTKYITNIITVFDDRIGYDINDSIGYFSIAKEANGLSQRVTKICNLCQKTHTDIVVSFLTEENVYAILASIGQKWKVIICERGDPRFSPKQRRVRILRKVLYRLANGYVFQTVDAQNFFPTAIKNKSAVIINPLSSEVPVPKQNYTMNRIISAGRLNEVKNYEMAIEACAILANEYSDFVYEIYGEGPQKKQLEDLIKSNNLENNVKLCGQTKNIYEKIEEAGLFLLTSKHEGFSNALMEAVALGVPAISTNVCGASQLIKNGYNGFIISKGSSKDLADKMLICLKNNEFKQRALLNSTSLREEFSIESIVLQWEQYMLSIAMN